MMIAHMRGVQPPQARAVHCMYSTRMGVEGGNDGWLRGKTIIVNVCVGTTRCIVEGIGALTEIDRGG